MSKSAIRTAATILCVAAVPVLAACAPSAAVRPTTAQGRVDACPLAHLSGVAATATDIPDGVVVTFTGPPEQKDLVEASVRAMNDANHKSGDAFAVCPCASPAPGMAIMQRAPYASTDPYVTQEDETISVPPPAADTKVVETQNGAQLQLVPADAYGTMNELERSFQSDTLWRLRTEVHKKVAILNAACLGRDGRDREREPNQ